MYKYRNGEEITEYLTDGKQNLKMLYRLKIQAIQRYFRDKKENRYSGKEAILQERRIEKIVEEFEDIEKILLERGWLKEMYENNTDEWLNRLAYLEYLRQQEELQVNENMTSSEEEPRKKDILD